MANLTNLICFLVQAKCKDKSFLIHTGFLWLGILFLAGGTSVAQAQVSNATTTIPSPQLSEVSPVKPTEAVAAPLSADVTEPIPAGAPTIVAPPSIPDNTSLVPTINEAYIDPTGYSIGATRRAEPSTAIAQRRQSPTPVISDSASSSWVNTLPTLIQPGSTTTVGHSYVIPKIQIPTRQGISIGLMFPLSIPAPITSIFGWRVHPISGVFRFHSGTDIGAPLGTPVLAAYAGKVAIADLLSGYGLAVALEHQKGDQETLYAHLSEIFVKPGQWVKQGDVIGRVGSTGTATGPNLHFELRQSTPEGWAVIDSGAQLEYALASLVKALQTDKSSAQARSIKQKQVSSRVGSVELVTKPTLPFELRQSTLEAWAALDPGVQLEYILAQLVKPLQTAKSPAQPRS